MEQDTVDRQQPAEPGRDASEIENQGTLVDLSAWLGVLRREIKTLFAFAGLFLLAAVLIAMLLPVKFTSIASFIPPSLNGGSAASALAGQLGGAGVGELLGSSRSSGELYAAILESRSITSELVSRFDLIHLYKVRKMSQAESRLLSNTTITVDSKSGIITLEVTDRSPERARDLTNAYLEALRQKNGSLALSQASQRRLFFEQQLAKEKDALEDAEVELKKTQESSGLIAPTGQTESEIRTIASTQAEVAARQVELASLLQSSTEQNPEVIRLRSEIADLNRQLSVLQRGSGTQPNASIPTSKVPGLQLEYVRKEREVKYHETLFEMLARQYEAARLDESRDAPILQVLDSASLPDAKSSPKRTLITLCGLAIGFLLGCTYVLFKEYKRLRRGTPALQSAG